MRKLEDSHFSTSKLYHKATIVKILWFWNKGRLVNGIYNSEVNIYVYCPLVFKKGAK